MFPLLPLRSLSKYLFPKRCRALARWNCHHQQALRSSAPPCSAMEPSSCGIATGPIPACLQNLWGQHQNHIFLKPCVHDAYVPNSAVSGTSSCRIQAMGIGSICPAHRCGALANGIYRRLLTRVIQRETCAFCVAYLSACRIRDSSQAVGTRRNRRIDRVIAPGGCCGQGRARGVVVLKVLRVATLQKLGIRTERCEGIGAARGIHVFFIGRIDHQCKDTDDRDHDKEFNQGEP